jgi:multiple sugar transport system permease protein
MARAPKAERRNRRRGAARQGERIWAFNFLAPFIVGIAVFYYIAIAASSYFSLTRYNLLKPPRWLGLDNFRYLLGDEIFRKALWNTAKLTLIGVPLTIVLAVALGVALNSKIRFRSTYRLAFFLPLVTMPVASAIVWRWLYAPDTGLFNQLLSPLGVDRVEWLSRPGTALWAVMAMEIWRQSGLFLLIVLAGLQSIPEVYYEAAIVDGATPWQRFRHVTLPLLSPSLFFLAVTGSIAAFQTFDAVIVLTPTGGPLNSTRTVVFDIYENAFESLRMGRAAAASLLLLAVILAVTVVQFRLQKRWVHYE